MNSFNYEKIEEIILNQINKVHMYRMCYFKDLRNEEYWDYYLHDNMDDGYKLIHKAIDKYLFKEIPQTFIDEVMIWLNTSNIMLKDLRMLLRKKYNRHYIISAIKGYTIKYNENLL